MFLRLTVIKQVPNLDLNYLLTYDYTLFIHLASSTNRIFIQTKKSIAIKLHSKNYISNKQKLFQIKGMFHSICL